MSLLHGTDLAARRHLLTVNATLDTAVDFRSLLLDELEQSGVIPDAEHILACRRQVTRIGSEEVAALADVVGPPLWAQALAQLRRPFPQADCERVLGFGAMLTAFMVAPVPIDEALRQEVCSLGALANLLVGLFDQVADECPGTTLPLSASTIERACMGRGRVRLAWYSRTGPPVARLLTRLVAAYCRRLDHLPHCRLHPSVRSLQTHAIVRMHAAELQTLQLASPVSQRVVRRKAALPFVVMGMPAWLAADRVPPATFRAHLRWLYRIGSFFGDIDDAADLDADRAAGRPNRVAALLAQAGTGTLYDDAKRLAHTIASEGRRILSGRAPMLAGASGAATDHVLPTTVLSWLDAVPR